MDPANPTHGTVLPCMVIVSMSLCVKLYECRPMSHVMDSALQLKYYVRVSEHILC